MNKSYIFLLVIASVFVGCSIRGGGVYHYDNYSSKASIHIKRYPLNGNYSHKPPKTRYSKATMKPYVVRGVKYYPTVVSIGDKFYGISSWYGPNFHGKLTSNGERYNMWAMTAAHKTLPMNTILKVTNRRNGKSVVVRVNDRGPFVSTRIIDLSKAAASKIDMIGTGTAPVVLEVLGFEGKNNRKIPTKKELKKSPKKVALGGKFALQIASFKNIQGALITQEKYDNIDGYKTIIKDIETQDNIRMFKVWLTGFRSEQEARDYKKTSRFKHAFIVKED